MTKDPVCGKKIDENKAPATSSYEGKKYSFCGQDCKDKFDEQPAHFAQSAQQQPQHANR
jgi:Cu+-exporting ATPase